MFTSDCTAFSWAPCDKRMYIHKHLNHSAGSSINRLRILLKVKGKVVPVL
jgi:hypothetical protein